MIPGARYLKLVCILCAAVPAIAASGPGYLRVVGPAPLRFWSPAPHKPEPVATNAAPSAVSTAPEPEPNPYDFLAAFGNYGAPTEPGATPDYQAGANSAAPSYPAAGMNAGPGGPQSGDVVSPQMFLQYFNHSTNGVGAGIIAPINPGYTGYPGYSGNPQAPPSSATYSH